MPKIIIINDLTVNINRSGRASAMWNDGKARYHFWFDADDAPERGLDGVIYKNPIETGLSVFDPRYFSTRQLDPKSKTLASVVAEVWARIEREDLIEKARDALNAEAVAERQRMEVAKVLFLKQQAGPALYDALKAVLAIEPAHVGNLGADALEAYLKAEAAIAKADGREG
jgi:hypothetical protein